ncbi:hypothetical protein QE454_001731 [Microbacterium sp. SORGH_AS454]|nr:hypothetical protein [Microbacterium sp. SORGH_AS_0454]
MNVLEVLLDRVVVGAEGGPELLEDTGGRPVDLDRDARLVVGKTVEGHDTGVVLVAPHAVPRDALVGVLLGDLGVEFALGTGDLDLPVREGVALLRDGLHEAHEVRELLELRPLVVRDADGNVDVDGFDDLCHGVLFSCGFRGFPQLRPMPPTRPRG